MACLLQCDISPGHSKPGTPPLSPKTAEPGPERLSMAQADMQEGVQDSQTSIHGKQGVHEDSQAKLAEPDAPPLQSPADESEQLDIPSNGPSNRTLQQQQDFTDPAYMHSVDRHSQSSDGSLSAALDPQATTNNNIQPNSTHLDSFGSLIETRPDSNGNAATLSTQDAPIQETTTPELTGSALTGSALTATAADTQTHNAHSLSSDAELMPEAQPEQQAEQQLPTSGLYMSSQMDQSSRSSLAESVQSDPPSQQHPVGLESVFASQPQPDSLDAVSAKQHRSASPSSSGEADELGQAAPQQVTSTEHEGEGSAANQEASGSQQSPLDSHEQQAELPGTAASTAHVPILCQPGWCLFLTGSLPCWHLAV